MLMILYLNFKILFFIFLIIINSIITIHYFKKIFKKIIKKIESKEIKKIILIKIINLKMNKIKYTNYLDYIEDHKNLKELIYKSFLYLLTFPIILTINFINIFLNNILHIISKALKFITNHYKTILNNKKRILFNILKISIIFSSLIIYVTMILNKTIFSEECIDIYNTITTVILIPLVYDSIKEWKK